MIKFSLFFVILIASQLINAEEPTCSKGYEKSAVTEEATKEAEAARENPRKFESDVYSSRVKSNTISRLKKKFSTQTI